MRRPDRGHWLPEFFHPKSVTKAAVISIVFLVVVVDIVAAHTQ